MKRGRLTGKYENDVRIIENEFSYVEGVEIEQVFTLANTSYTLTHNLNKAVAGYKDIKCNTYGRFKFISSTFTTLILQCDTAATTATIRIF